jgi:hypothetical protein
LSVLAYLMIAAVGLCAVAMVMTVINLRVYTRAPRGGAEAGQAPAGGAAGVGGEAGGEAGGEPLISVCIPARNEERNIEACVRGILSGTYRRCEVLVYNDHSTDGTGAILSRLGAEDARVRAVTVEPLPAGWNGKQFACDRMGRAASGEWLLFTDADVRFEPTALAETLAAARARGAAGGVGVDLLSTFPRQVCGSLAEIAAVPMIFFILFSYLPMPRMRATSDPASSAGCGQFLFARREAYLASGGHGAFADSMHDGIKMPRAFRAKGFRTDLFDGTHLASVRMYVGLGSTWRGFAKNAYEGLGSVGLLVFVTVVHLLAHVLPFVVLAAALTPMRADGVATVLAGFAAGIALVQRGILTARFTHPWLAVPLHPVAVLMMTAIQWHSLYLHLTGQRAWRGRTLAAG